MFDIGWPELMIVAIVLIVVVGPKDLPRMLRTFGQTANKLKSMAGDFRRQFDDALKEADLDDVKSIITDAQKLDPTADIRKELNPMRKMGEQIKAGLDDAIKPGVKSGGKTDDVKAPEPSAKLSDVPPNVGSADKPAVSKADPAPAAKPAAKPTAKRTATKSAGGKSAANKKPAARKATAKKPAAKATAKRASRKISGAAS